MFYMEQNNRSTAWLNDLLTALGFTIEFLLQTMIIGLKKVLEIMKGSSLHVKNSKRNSLYIDPCYPM